VENFTIIAVLRGRRLGGWGWGWGRYDGIDETRKVVCFVSFLV